RVGTVVLPVTIIVFSTYCLAGRRRFELKDDRLAWLFGFTGGVLGGAYGMNGPPLVVYGSLRHWSPEHFRATLQGYFLPASLLGMCSPLPRSGLLSCPFTSVLHLPLHPGFARKRQVAIGVARMQKHAIEGKRLPTRYASRTIGAKYTLPGACGSMTQQRRYAILIGVDGYEDRQAIPALKYCTADCKLLQRALLRAGGFEPDNVLLMVDDASSSEYLPRRNNIIGQLLSWAQRPAKGDLFLVVFCGHAREIDGKVYLLPADARATNLPLTGLPVEVILSALQESLAQSKLLFLGACHSGAGRDLGLMTPSFVDQLRAEGITILSACKVNEVAHECDEVKQGIFSFFIARGLQGEAVNSAGVVSCDSLYHYVHREVVAWAAGRGLAQPGWGVSEGVGDAILIGRLPARARSAEASGLNMPRFHYGSVVPPEFYIDREKDLSEAADIIEAGQSLLLVGDRRAGKTSFCKKLIHQLMGRPDNAVLASYLNLQRCHKLKIETFLRETLSDMIGEIARQVFKCKFMDLLRRNPLQANPIVRDDPLFEPFLSIFRLARKHIRSGHADHLSAHDFVRLVNELLEII